MASLVGIPVELLGLICSGLGTGDILNLCRSCKGLYSAAHPLLFRHITIAWNLSSATDEPPNLISLLLFILKRPSYARYIKTVDIPRVNYGAYLTRLCRLDHKGKLSNLSPEETALVTDVVEELSPPGPGSTIETWCLAVDEEAHLGAIIALILALSTHLESLTVDVGFLPPSNTWFTDMISNAVSAPDEAATRLSRFHKLTHLTLINRQDPDLDLRTEIFLLCFYLPSITTLCFDNALFDQGTELWDPTSASHQGSAWPLAHPPLAASLTTLQLNFTSARPSAIEFLLRHTPNLRSLVYNCKLPSSCSPLDVPVLRQGLGHVRDTLAQLTVRFEIFADEALDPESLLSVTHGSLGPLGSLLPALEDLNVSLGMLLGQVKPQGAPPLADVLPTGLRRLTVNDDLWNYDAFDAWRGEPVGALLMAFFAGACGTATPLLEEFVLDMRNWFVSSEYWDDEGGKEALQELVESQGIRCFIWGGEDEQLIYEDLSD